MWVEASDVVHTAEQADGHKLTTRAAHLDVKDRTFAVAMPLSEPGERDLADPLNELGSRRPVEVFDGSGTDRLFHPPRLLQSVPSDALPARQADLEHLPVQAERPPCPPRQLDAVVLRDFLDRSVGPIEVLANPTREVRHHRHDARSTLTKLSSRSSTIIRLDRTDPGRRYANIRPDAQRLSPSRRNASSKPSRSRSRGQEEDLPRSQYH
jgi:hypothetical protein